jgi:hypothetical protein
LASPDFFISLQHKIRSMKKAELWAPPVWPNFYTSDYFILTLGARGYDRLAQDPPLLAFVVPTLSQRPRKDGATFFFPLLA